MPAQISLKCGLIDVEVGGRVAARQEAAMARTPAKGTEAKPGALTDEVVDQLKKTSRAARRRRADR